MRLMRVVPLMALVALPSMLLGMQRARDENGSAAEIRRLEHEWVQAARNADTAAFGRLMAPNGLEIISNGTVHDRADCLSGFGSGRVRTTAADLSDVRVHVNGDMAVVTGLATGRDSFPENGQARDFQLRYMRVWERRGRHWEVTAIQWTAAQSRYSGGLTGGIPLADSGAAKQALEHLDWQRFQAVQRVDIRALDTLLADDWLASGAAPQPVTKAQYLAELAAGTRRFGDIRHDDVHVRIYGDAAVITGRSTGQYRIDGRELNTSGRFTHIYARRNGRWVMVGMHNSVIATPIAIASRPVDPAPVLATRGLESLREVDVRDAVLAVEHERRAALRKPDPDALAQILADDFVEVGPEKVRTKPMNIGDGRTGRLRWMHLAVSDEAVTIFDSTAAAVTGVLNGDGTYDGRPFKRHTRFLRMYTKRDGRWQNVAAANVPIRRNGL